jgi:hypothetical protein
MLGVRAARLWQTRLYRKPAKITSGGGRIGMVGEHYRTKNAKGLGPHNSTRAREALPFEK